MKQTITFLFLLLSLFSKAQVSWGVYSGSNSERDADRLEVRDIRNAINLQTGYGLQRMQKGYNYYTVVTYKSGIAGSKAIPTAAQIPAAKAKLIALLKAAPFLPRMLIVENEENWNMANGSVGSYVAWFEAVADVAKMFGISISNGGTTMPTIRALAYNYLLATGHTLEAKAFKARYKISYSTLQSANWLLIEMNQLKAKGFGSMPWNFHYQFTDDYSVIEFTTCIEAIEYYGFKHKMSNEIAQRNNDARITAKAVQGCSLLDYAQWYNTIGESGQARPLTGEQMDMFIAVNKF